MATLRALSLLACIGLLGQSAQTQQMRDLQVSQWLQAPAGFSGQSTDLRGKVVVLEFWATWCPPCIAAIPHLNQLANEFRNEGVLFLAITDDDPDRLKEFLTKQPVNAIIGSDPERKSWAIFDVPSIPHTILIGKDGHIVGATLPENVTADVLRDALAGKSPALPPKEGVQCDLEWDEHYIEWHDGIPPTMYAIVKPIKTVTSGGWPRPGHVTADGVSLEVLVRLAYNTDEYHVDWRMPRDERTYRAAFRVPAERNEELLSYMQQTLRMMFGIHANWTEQLREVYVLRRIEGRPPMAESRSDEELVQMIRGEIKLRRQPMAKLCEMLANSFHSVVLNETGMNGRYDLTIPYQPGQPDVTVRALNDMGLEAVRAQRDVKVLVVTPEQTKHGTQRIPDPTGR